MANDCLFCRIAAREIGADVVHDDEEIFAFRDINPKAPIHVLVIPRRHIASAAELGENEGLLLGRMFAVMAQLARDDGIAADGYRIVTNVGANAGQSVEHLHFHLLGGRRLGWPPG
jgi:histidine triad (HIT) family protein